MTDKNHEQYLEQIETAVMETTKSLMTEPNQNLRAMAKVCAEKQVEINRLKEFQKDDRKTIRELRGHLKELAEEGVAEVTELKEELEEWKAIHPEWSPSGDLTPNFISECLDDQYENIKELKKKVEELEEELEYEADTSFADLNEEIEKLKGERENASYQLAGELEDINTRWAEDKEADRIVIEKLKAEMNRVFQAVYSYDGDYDGKIDELEDKAKTKLV